MSYMNGGYDNDGKSDFEREFKQSVSIRPEVLAEEERNKKLESKKKERVLLIVLFVIAILGAILIVILLVSSFEGFDSDSGEEDTELLEDIDTPQDDNDAYKDLPFSENDSNAPLLVYAAVKEGKTVDRGWLEEFKSASVRYAEKYEKTALSSSATFSTVTISDIEGELYPNLPLKRFLITSSEGCARFDFYEDLLVLYDYDLIEGNCLDS